MRHPVSRASHPVKLCDRCEAEGTEEEPLKEFKHEALKIRDKGARKKRNFLLCAECQEWAFYAIVNKPIILEEDEPPYNP